MFETVVPETHVRRSRRVFYETLPVSLAVHALAVAGVLLSTLWNIAFPSNSPSLSAAYSLTALPDPPPPPPPPEVLQTAPKVETRKPDTAPPPPALLDMAPRVIPNLVPRVEIPPPLPVAPVTQAREGAVPGGDVNGTKEGIVGGEVGGHLRGLAGSVVFPDDGRVYVERGEKLPMEPIKQEPPSYPDEARKKHLEDSVLVRYVIGTNGRVKDVTILDHAREPMFDVATVDAISRWTFRPLKKEGKSVEVVHELMVFYQLITH